MDTIKPQLADWITSVAELTAIILGTHIENYWADPDVTGGPRVFPEFFLWIYVWYDAVWSHNTHRGTPIWLSETSNSPNCSWLWDQPADAADFNFIYFIYYEIWLPDNKTPDDMMGSNNNNNNNNNNKYNLYLLLEPIISYI